MIKFENDEYRCYGCGKTEKGMIVLSEKQVVSRSFPAGWFIDILDKTRFSACCPECMFKPKTKKQ